MRESQRSLMQGPGQKERKTCSLSYSTANVYFEASCFDLLGFVFYLIADR